MTGAGHLPFPALLCQRPHSLGTALGMPALRVSADTDGTRRGTVAGLLCERCGTENRGGTRLFERQKRRVKGPQICPGRRVPLTVLEPGPEGGGGQGCWLQGRQTGQRAGGCSFRCRCRVQG